jgi:hypothetical protein
MKAFGSIALLLALAASAREVHAQSPKGPGDYIGEASQRLGDMIEGASRADYGLYLDSFLLGGSFVKLNQGNWVKIAEVDLERANSYIFLAAGDGDALDVDVQVLDPNGNMVAQDVTNNVTASAEYSPAVSGRYALRLRLAASRGNFPCYCMAAMLRKGTGDKRLLTSKGASGYINQAAGRLGRMIDNSTRAGYRPAADALLLTGAELRQSKTDWIELGTVDLDPNCTYIVMGAGDADATDVDIQIQSPDRTVVAKDDSTNVDATVEYRPPARGRYTIRMRLFASQRDLPCYCIAAVLFK